MRMKTAVFAMATAAMANPAAADIVTSGADHYILKHEAVSSSPPDAVWARLIEPASWWSGDHTYSGDANNLSLDPRAGGHWRETFAGGSVLHGTVIYVDEGETLRLNAPFGPLQEMGVSVVWTISIAPEGDGTKVTFTEKATGASKSSLDKIAPAVDAVKRQAIENLVNNEN